MSFGFNGLREDPGVLGTVLINSLDA